MQTKNRFQVGLMLVSVFVGGVLVGLLWQGPKLPDAADARPVVWPKSLADRPCFPTAVKYGEYSFFSCEEIIFPMYYEKGAAGVVPKRRIDL